LVCEHGYAGRRNSIAVGFHRNGFIPTMIGVIAAFATAALLFLTIGVYVLFNIFWGCSPYHRVQPDPEPCSSLTIPVSIVTVTGVCLLVGWPVYGWAKRTVAKRLKRGRS
jgi:hypothetical protein